MTGSSAPKLKLAGIVGVWVTICLVVSIATVGFAGDHLVEGLLFLLLLGIPVIAFFLPVDGPGGIGPISPGLLLFLSWFVGIQLGFALEGRWKKSSMESGDKIVNALDAYRQIHDAYPEALPDLANGHLPAVPRPDVAFGRHDFWYWKGDDGYRVAFPLSAGMVMEYRSHEGRWKMRD